jgi:hypothetical protein
LRPWRPDGRSPCHDPNVPLALIDELGAIVDALAAEGVDYALALAIHGVPRATIDDDLLLRPEDLGMAREQQRLQGGARVRGSSSPSLVSHGTSSSTWVGVHTWVIAPTPSCPWALYPSGPAHASSMQGARSENKQAGPTYERN